ncbi:MAG: CBS domain-containing protein [Myxococcota bacterium]
MPEPSERLVEELMTPVPVVVAQTATIGECTLRMHHLNVRHLPVVDDEGRIAGLVLDSALHRLGAVFGTEYVAFDLEDERKTAREVARPADVLVEQDTPLNELLRRMGRTRQDAAVVIDEDVHPVGIVTEHDLLKVALDVVPAELTVEQLPPRLHVSLSLDAPASLALDAMERLAVRHLVVTDRRGRIGAVVSHRDLVAEDVLRRDVPTADVVRSLHPVTVAPGATVRSCAEKMLEGHIGCLPVVVDDRPLRLVSRRDVIDAAARRLAAEG